MKKKIISLLAVFCFILPSFFAVACKNKNKNGGDDPKGIDAYTYSVTLKNAKGLIDESSLHGEYDYEQQKDVSWTASGNDYTLSVVRTSVLSGELEVSLLEGYDYSNLSFTINNDSAEGDVKSGNKANCEKDAYLTDRQFCYEYEDMKAETKLVVDFSDCAWAKISVDFSELNEQGIKCYKAVDDFVTITTEKNNALVEFSSEVVEVDYGTIFAFDCAQKLVFKPSTSEEFQDLNFSKYGSKYYFGTNKIQHFTAKQNGECVVYNAVKDYSNRGTIRVLGCSDVTVHSSIENLQENKAINSVVESESYGGSYLKLDVFSGSRLFVKLSGDAANFNYYLVESIDQELSPSKRVAESTLEGTEILYLDVNIANQDGSESPAKYLVRRPKNESNYFVVYALDFSDTTRFINADYVLVGSKNKPTVPYGYQGNIFFGFEKDKEVEIEVCAYSSDSSTDFLRKNTAVSINATAYETNGMTSSRYIEMVSQEPIVSSVLAIDCYDVSDDFAFYEIYVNYVKTRINNAEVLLDPTNVNLYEGEKVYYSTNIKDSNSWNLLTEESILSISSRKTSSVYYYIVSERDDTFLQIQNASGEVVSVTGELRDCFGRRMTGTVSVGGDTINLSKVRFLDIKPGSYSSYTAKLLREYEKEYHNINLTGLGSSKLMVSVNGYTTNGSSFKNAKTLSELSIKYKGYGVAGSIYYYVDNELNQYLQLKDSKGNVVSTSTPVIESKKPLIIDGNIVYCLSLNGGYFAESEEFSIELVTPTYGLKYDNGNPAEIYTSADLSGEVVSSMVYGETYYFAADTSKTYAVIDSEINPIILTFEKVSDIEEGVAVYKFTVTFSDEKNYVSGTEFKLRAFDQQ